jgi:hypothetical protein
MLDVQSLDRFSSGRIMDRVKAMSDETDDPELAAERLEAALERIARLAARPKPVVSASITPEPVDESALSAEEIAERLDTLIDRLRAALNRPAERS